MAYEDLKSRISMPDLAVRLGLSPDGGGFVRCPFHGERTGSLKLYDGDGGWYCFGCGLSGDQIDFVKRYFNVDFRSAVKELAHIVGVSVNLDQSRPAPRQFQFRKDAAKARSAFRLKQIDKDLGRARREEAELSSILDRRPKGWSEIDDDHVNALRRIDLVRYTIESLEHEQYEIEATKY